MDNTPLTIADRLRVLRGIATQKTIADRCGLQQQRWSKWESGQEAPNLVALTKITQALEVSLDWLVLGKGKAPTTPKER